MAKSASTARSKPGMIDTARGFAQEVRTEMEKVTWPSQSELKAHTSVVLVFIGILAVLVGTMDIVFNNIVLWLFRLV